MAQLVLTHSLTDQSLVAWTAVALGFRGVCYDGQGGIMSPDPEDSCAYDVHDYLRRGVGGTLWNWWLQRAQAGHALRMVQDASGQLIHEAVMGAYVWRGSTVEEALCRALVSEALGHQVPTLYPWGDALETDGPFAPSAAERRHS